MTAIWLPVAPLVAALVARLPLGRRTPPLVTSFAMALVLGLTAAVLRQVLRAGTAVAVPGWVAVDGLSALIVLIVALVAATAVLYSVGYFAGHDVAAPALRRYYSDLNLFIFAMLAVPVLVEPNLVWIAVELTTLLSVMLVAYDNTHMALEAGWKYVVLTMMGAPIALLGFLVLFWAHAGKAAGPYTWTGIAAVASAMSPRLVLLAFVLILVGFGAKVGLVPFHTWLPDAHSQAPTPVCALLSGVKTTVVLYVILRLFPILRGAQVAVDRWAIGVGLLSVGAAALLLLQVRDYKRLFAFSTVEHMGIILTAVGLGGAAGAYGAAYQILNHALTKSFCFYAAGSVLLGFGTREIASVRGLLRSSPGTGLALLLGGLVIGGAPPFAVFSSEFEVLRSGVLGGHGFAVGLLALFIVVAFFGVMAPVHRMVFGEPAATVEARSVPWPCTVSLALAALPLLVLGVYVPPAIHQLLVQAGRALGGG